MQPAMLTPKQYDILKLNLETDTQCPISFEPYGPGSSPVVLKCKHVISREKMLQINQCPSCQKPIKRARKIPLLASIASEVPKLFEHSEAQAALIDAQAAKIEELKNQPIESEKKAQDAQKIRENKKQIPSTDKILGPKTARFIQTHCENQYNLHDFTITTSNKKVLFHKILLTIPESSQNIKFMKLFFKDSASDGSEISHFMNSLGMMCDKHYTFEGRAISVTSPEAAAKIFEALNQYFENLPMSLRCLFAFVS